MADFAMTVIGAMFFVLDDEDSYSFDAIDFQTFSHED
jgi:hypothetical protein